MLSRYSLSADRINRFRRTKLVALACLVFGPNDHFVSDSPACRLLSACSLDASAHVQGDVVSAARELSAAGETGGGTD